MGYTGQGVLVGQLDTGIVYDHTDLDGRLWDGGEEFPNHGFDVFYHDNDPLDHVGHGTKVAGIICGTGVSGTQTGVAPDATVMAVKVFPDDDGHSYDAITAEAMQFAIEHGAQVLNMSLGMAGQAEVRRGVYRQAADNVLAAGVLTVASAGNERYYLDWGLLAIPYVAGVPGACPSPWPHPDQAVNLGEVSAVVSVGSVDDENAVTWFSSPGPTTWADSSGFGDYPYTPGSDVEIGLIKPDVVAIGHRVVSLKYDEPEGYVADAGTSFSAPQVTGVVALMLSKNPDLTPREIDSILQTTALKLTEHKSNDTGSGLVDALGAILAIDGCSGVSNLDYDIAADIVSLTWEGSAESYLITVDGEEIGSTSETHFDLELEDGNHEVCVEPADCPTQKACLSLEFLGLNETTAQANVYPNPSTDGFTVECNGMTEANVYSLDGKLVKRIFAEDQCNIEGLSNGVYLLKINTMNGTLVQKIVRT
ncbi:MAG: S8 family peptidase [Bacteroidales bacterium]|nr:S8 family peptidase [Bacteroidales bacterium]